ncbi:MAG: fructokinase [Verrucomicrobiales bacterium]|jgi:fructokinase
MNRPKIISLGEVLWDLFPDGPRFGGAPANFACHSAILGGEVTMVSAVGDDESGREAIRILDGFEIDTKMIQVDPKAPTGEVKVDIDVDGDHEFTIHEGSAWDQLEWTQELEQKAAQADAVYFGTLGQRGESSRSTIQRALDVAKTAGVLRILDINLRAPFFDDQLIRESIKLASVLKLSHEELGAVARACGIQSNGDRLSDLQALRENFGLELIVMTRGPDGALLVKENSTFDQPGIPTKVVDTVGAGDSFTAAFLIGLLSENSTETIEDSTETILRAACETAAKVCAQPGAVPDQTRSINSSSA